MIISLRKNLFTPDINNKLYLDDRGSNSIFVMGGIELATSGSAVGSLTIGPTG